MSDRAKTHWLDREDRGDLTVVRFKVAKLMDDDDTRDMFAGLNALVDAMRRRRLVLDLGKVEYVASLALGKLVMLNKKVQIAGGRLALCNVNPAVDKVLTVTHLKDVLHVSGSEEGAVHAVQTDPPPEDERNGGNGAPA